MNELVCVKDFEARAHSVLTQNARDYYKSGAGDELTLGLNKNAFQKIRIRPRCLRDVSKRDMETSMFGSKVTFPVGIAATAMQRMAHPEGECDSARAAEEMGTIFTLSTIATSSIEEIAEAAPNATKWFQLYIYTDRELTKSLIRRAEKSGFKALLLTVDTPIFGLRRADMRNKFTLPSHLSLANFDGDKATDINKSKKGSGLNEYITDKFDASLTWKDVKWLLSITKLPVLLKGILTAEDAVMAADIGVAGIVISNHGGRQLDGVPATIEALAEIAKVVGHRITIVMDGGVSQGDDVLKAIALGAKMVFIGRPVLWGLACGGKEGVKKVLEIIKQELDTAMAVAGCQSLKDITRSLVVHESYYNSLVSKM